MRNLQRLSSFLSRFSTFSAAGKILWGIWLCMPQWNTFERTASLRVMGDVFSETTWGIIFLCIGFFHLLMLLTMRKRWLMMIASYLSVIIWLYLAWILAIGNITAPGSAIYACIAFIEIFHREDYTT